MAVQETQYDVRMPAPAGSRGLARVDFRQFAHVLGWFSIGLGLAQIIMPGRLAQLIGMDDDDTTVRVMRLIGVREIIAGLGIFSHPWPTPWLQARVAGDVMDLAILGGALTSGDVDEENAVVATLAVAGITALDIVCSEGLRQIQ